jgi:hypothetical protein
MRRYFPDGRGPRRLMVLVLFALGTGCAASQKSESAPQSAPAGEGVPAAAPAPQSGGDRAADEEAAPTTLEEAEAALRRAEAELSNALGPLAFAQPPAAAPAPAPPAEASGSAPREAEQRAEKADKKGRDQPNCDLACRAFSSLARAASAVCRLDGDGGERCGRARQTLSDAEARVSGCSCSRP